MVTHLKKRIGLFGGSFNPAHEGHLYISRLALEKLKLDEIWWLISPQNPLKKPSELGDYRTRLEGARKLSRGNAIKILETEKEQGLVYTVDTLSYLKKKFPDYGFVWVMGADCFLELPEWKFWREIMALVPVAVFPRPGYTKAALSGTAATVYAKNRLPEMGAGNLVMTKPPAWVYIDCKPMDVSGTELRRRGQG